MRPIFWEFPKDESFFAEERMSLTGDALLSVMISEENQAFTQFTLPKTTWYHFPMEVSNFSEKYIRDHFKPYSAGSQITNFNCGLNDGIPIFLRSGKIILTKERPRRNSELMSYDPYTLYIATDTNGRAESTHYDDNYRSLKSSYTITRYAFDNGTLKLSTEGTAKVQDYQIKIERVVILKPNGQHVVIKKPENLTTSDNKVVKLY